MSRLLVESPVPGRFVATALQAAPEPSVPLKSTAYCLLLMLFQVTVLLPPWDVKPVMAGRLNLIDRSSINMTPVTVEAPPDAKLTRSCVVPTGTANRCDISWNGDVETFPVQPGLLVDPTVLKS